MTVRHLCCVLAFGLGLVPRAAAPSDATTSSPVVLDLVVRDKKNAPIVDLKAEEVELFVDGAKQPFEGFRRVTIPTGGGPAATAAAPETARLAVLLFPRLPGAERDLARSAAEEFVKKQLGPGMSVAVLLVGQELVPVQGFTSDPAVLKDAIKRAVDPGARSGDPDVRALYSLVLWLKGQPGRKTVLLFASALAVPPGFEDSLKDVVGLANQQRITFYGVDPRGSEMSGGRHPDRPAGGGRDGRERRAFDAALRLRGGERGGG